jgi:hypothetical protein
MMEARFEHGQLFGILRVLFQITHTQITTEGNGAIVIPFLAGKDIEQCRLATAVLGYQSDTLSLGQAQRDIFE